MKTRIVHLADVHYGSNRVAPEWIYDNLKRYLYPQLEKCQLLVIAGDFFDMLLTMDSKTVQYAIRTMTDIFDLAKQHGFLVRLLRGTFSHDRTQNKIFEHLAGSTDIFKYFDTISLEYIESLDLKILYVPDNTPFTESEDCLAEIHRQMRQVGWTQVDMVVLHGYFDHVLPANVPKKPPCLFTASQFKKIVKGFVHAGHHHGHSMYERVIYSGSFERTAHGEEENKGFVVADRDGDNWKFEFIINKDAMVFKTIKLTSESFDDCVTHVEKALKKIFKDHDYIGYVRIIHPSRDIMKCLCDYLANKYTTLKVKGKTDVAEQEKEILEEDFVFDLADAIVPNEENLPELLDLYATETNPEKTLTLSMIDDLLKELK